jgi:hypothetical protein
MSGDTTLQTQDGTHYLTAELNGDVVADRTTQDAWQWWTVEPDPNGDPSVCGLKSAHGKYLSAYPPEYCAQLGLPIASVKATATYLDAWERWQVARDGGVVRLKSMHTGLWLSPQNVPPSPHGGGGAVLVNGPAPGGWETLVPSNMAAFGGSAPGPGPGPTPPPGEVRPLLGQVRIHGRSFADASGPRLLHGCSDFGALAKMHEDRDRMLRQLDVVASHQQYIRVFWRLNGGFWTDSGVTVDPIRDPWFDEVCLDYLTACWERGIKVNLTSGDFYNWTDTQAEDSFRRVAQIARSVSPELVWLSAVANEMRGTMPGGESDENVAKMSHYLTTWAATYPWALLAGSDPGSQDRDGMARLAPPPSNVALIHDVRWSGEDAIRRCFNTAYEGYSGKPIVQDEPTGENGNVPRPFGQLVYQPTQDPHYILAIYTMQVLTGQAATYFSDPSLASREPLETTWGFTGLLPLWRAMEIPEGIGQGLLKPGHHGDAPLQVINSHASRADSMVLGGYSLGIISGGSGWQVRAGRSGLATAYTAAGVVWEGVVSPGQVFPIAGPTPTIVRIVS